MLVAGESEISGNDKGDPPITLCIVNIRVIELRISISFAKKCVWE